MRVSVSRRVSVLLSLLLVRDLQGLVTKQKSKQIEFLRSSCNSNVVIHY